MRTKLQLIVAVLLFSGVGLSQDCERLNFSSCAQCPGLAPCQFEMQGGPWFDGMSPRWDSLEANAQCDEGSACSAAVCGVTCAARVIHLVGFCQGIRYTVDHSSCCGPTS
jgi:hypothetical protein